MGVNGEALQLQMDYQYKKLYFLLQVLRELYHTEKTSWLF